MKRLLTMPVMTKRRNALILKNVIPTPGSGNLKARLRKDHAKKINMKSQQSKLLEILAECADACNTCSTACLAEQDVKAMADCIKLDMDCAQICQLTAAFISRNSDHAKHLMKACSKICKKCAEECSRHKVEHCRQCAEACSIRGI